MICKKNNLCFLLLMFFLCIHSQNKKEHLIGDFKYILKAKLSKSNSFKYEELFSLEITDSCAFFISDKSIELDSLFQTEFAKNHTSSSSNTVDFRGRTLPKTKFSYTIIQTSNNIQYFENIGMSLLSYNETPLSDWKLVNESKKINSFECRKAEVYFKGRNWIAWYTNEIPFPYGPYKFTGLPGLIIKISDSVGDYDFELVKSVSNSKLVNSYVNISKIRYTNYALTTAIDLKKAKENFISNLVGNLESMGTKFSPEQKENLRERQKQKYRDFMDENSIEIY